MKKKMERKNEKKRHRKKERKKERKDEKEKALKREGGRTHVIRSSFDLLIEFVLVLIPERGVTHQQDVKDDTWTNTHSLLVEIKRHCFTIPNHTGFV